MLFFFIFLLTGGSFCGILKGARKGKERTGVFVLKITTRDVSLVNPPSYETVLMTFNTAARNCYQSLNDATDSIESAETLARKLIAIGHGSPIEMNNITFRFVGDRACYDEETEVLTKDGWKLFKDLDKTNDLVATLNTATNMVEFYKPSEYIEYKYVGNMVTIKTKNCDLVVTPNHNLWAKKIDTRVPRNFEFHRADSLVNRYQFTKEFNYVPKQSEETVFIRGIDYDYTHASGKIIHRHTKDLILNKKLFTIFLAMYLSEGSVYHNKKEYSYAINLAQEDSEKNKKSREYMIKIITELGFTATPCAKRITFKNSTLGVFLKKLGTAIHKRFPYNVFDYFNKELALAFINTYLMYDGNKSIIYGKLYTSSKKLMSDLECISMIAGLSTHTFLRNDCHVGSELIINGNMAKCNANGYVINLTNKYNKTPYIDVRESVSKKTYDGNVYCVNVKNHIIMVKRNGVAVWCGNCMGQLTRHRLLSFAIESARYCNYNSKKFDHNVKFIKPKELSDDNFEVWEQSCKQAELTYFKLINLGAKPEVARSVLPMSLATTMIVSGNIREWRHVIELRCDKHAQEDIRSIMREALKLLYKHYPVFFEDLYTKYIRIK